MAIQSDLLRVGLPWQAPIGVFDSGVGGLSVLQALRAEMPAERFIYLADAGHAPYGERSDAFVVRRTLALARYLVQRHSVKALVLACNTATAAAIDQVRLRFPLLPVVGVEPALKPAASASRTGHIAVMATRSTVTSARFAKLVAHLPPDVHCRVQACDGLASAIDSELADAVQALGEAVADNAHGRTQLLCEQNLRLLAPFGCLTGEVDTLVLGCTHYVFAQAYIQKALGPDVQIFSTGEPVARQTKRLLAAKNALQPSLTTDAIADTSFLSTGDSGALARASQRWLGIEGDVKRISSHGRSLHSK